MSGALKSADIESGCESKTNDETMEKVNYQLADDLGTLTFEVPMHWVSGKTKGVDAIWFDQDGSPFRDNVTLKVRPFSKVDDAEELLDIYLKKLVESLEAKPVTDTEKTPGRRSIAFESTISDHDIAQQVLVLYAESLEKSYLLILNHSRLTTGSEVDLSPATINSTVH